jgi:hypothetical protein
MDCFSQLNLPRYVFCSSTKKDRQSFSAGGSKFLLHLIIIGGHECGHFKIRTNSLGWNTYAMIIHRELNFFNASAPQ